MSPERHSIRRYGFHGLAHRYMAERHAELRSEGARLITFQLGAGCSAAAIAGGRSLDTSMGLTPLEGLVMATRSGDVDPALPAFLEEHEGMGPADAERILNRDSGLKGVSGRSGDMRELLEADDERAELAIDLFCYRARKYIGAYLAVLGGADAIVFGGGVGENSPPVRSRICAGMGWCGLELDEDQNAQAVGKETRIDAGGPIEAWVVLVDEAQVMARDAEALLGGREQP
jgi:acetate kinase